VSLNNAGSGSLNWTASVDAAWLGVSPISGTIDAGADPSNLLVIANPSGLAANKSYSGTITLTKPATANDPEQIIIIHVSLAIGNIRNMGATSPKIFLPVIVR
jgi:hypothetical protein